MHMALSSGDPGVLVQPDTPRGSDFPSLDDPDALYVVKVLTLGPDAYESLDSNQNMFYCNAATQSGERQRAHFIVNKIARPVNPRQRYLQRNLHRQAARRTRGRPYRR